MVAGKLKKTMIYLGLADDDESYDDDRPVERRSIAPEPPASPAGTSSRAHYRAEAEQAPRAVEPQRRIQPEPLSESSASAQSRSAESGRTGGSVPSESQRRRPTPVREERQATVTPLKPAAEYNDEESTVHQITTIHPKSYNDAKLIGDSFRQGIPVIMNVTDIQESEAKRLVDFSAGLVFGLSGRISRVTNKVFLLTPEEIDVKAEGRDEDSADGDPIMAAH